MQQTPSFRVPHVVRNRLFLLLSLLICPFYLISKTLMNRRLISIEQNAINLVTIYAPSPEPMSGNNTPPFQRLFFKPPSAGRALNLQSFYFILVQTQLKVPIFRIDTRERHETFWPSCTKPPFAGQL